MATYMIPLYKTGANVPRANISLLKSWRPTQKKKTALFLCFNVEQYGAIRTNIALVKRPRYCTHNSIFPCCDTQAKLLMPHLKNRENKGRAKGTSLPGSVSLLGINYFLINKRLWGYWKNDAVNRANLWHETSGIQTVKCKKNLSIMRFSPRSLFPDPQTKRIDNTADRQFQRFVPLRCNQ